MNQFFIHRFQEKFLFSAIDKMNMGTQTITETREEADQDPQNGLDVIPRSISTIFGLSEHLGTQTGTATREELDQDKPTHKFFLIPKTSSNFSLGTQTMTKAKEEPDSDPFRKGTYIIPRYEK